MRHISLFVKKSLFCFLFGVFCLNCFAEQTVNLLSSEKKYSDNTINSYSEDIMELYNVLDKKIINLNKDKTIKSYKNGEIIFFEDQPCECASIILKGSIYMSSMYNDKEIKFGIGERAK